MAALHKKERMQAVQIMQLQQDLERAKTVADSSSRELAELKQSLREQVHEPAPRVGLGEQRNKQRGPRQQFRLAVLRGKRQDAAHVLHHPRRYGCLQVYCPLHTHQYGQRFGSGGSVVRQGSRHGWRAALHSRLC